MRGRHPARGPGPPLGSLRNLRVDRVPEAHEPLAHEPD